MPKTLLSELWRHRLRGDAMESKWFLRQVKRLYLAPALVVQEFRRRRLRAGGAKIGLLSAVGAIRADGNLRELSIGRGCAIGNVWIALHAPVHVGNNCVINDGVRILTASHDTCDPGWATFARPVVIEDHVWIAVGAMILPGMRIGRGAVVGAGAVVRQDVKEYSIVVGNPAFPTGKHRPATLGYVPSLRTALFEAWVGKVARIE